ncbi:transposase [Streptomyces sp. BE20]|uniref:transposase n=1 Tax=Streptomyces sp. BE20 TaxID=3002525 RepID=UPI002E7808D3|nr:transposase [Streptomyces sp. BE20]MEE1826622.1 transposase [Streptomyces sp. BE20]
MPVPAWLEGRGRQPEGYCHRRLVDAVRYPVSGGITWRAMPVDFPAWSASTRSSGAGGARAWSASSTTGCGTGAARRRAAIRNRPRASSTPSR